MPRIEDFSPISTSNNTNLKFKKKKYRPWNLLDDFSNETQERHIINNAADEEDKEPNKIQNKKNTNWTQCDNKTNTNRTQIEHKVDTNQTQSGHETGHEIEHKLGTKSGFLTLVGLQRKVLLFFYENCRNTRSKITSPFTLEILADRLNIRKGSVKTTIRRLETKTFIRRVDFKNGRSGWSSYEVPNSVFTELTRMETEHKLDTNWTQIEYKTNTKLDTKADTAEFSSSSKDLYKTTTTDQTIPSKPESPQLPDEWLAIDIEPLRSINFTHMHLSQLATEEQLTPKIVQQSIDFFAFDLSNNNKAKTIKGSPLNFFMGILRNRGGYVIPDNYGSPEERYMKDYAKKLRQQGEEMARLENEAIELSFKSWYVILPDQEKDKLLPGTDLSKNSDQYKFTGERIRRLAREYFKDVVWPNIRERVMAGEVLVDEYKEIDTDKQVYGILDLLREEAAIKNQRNPAP